MKSPGRNLNLKTIYTGGTYVHAHAIRSIPFFPVHSFAFSRTITVSQYLANGSQALVDDGR